MVLFSSDVVLEIPMMEANSTNKETIMSQIRGLGPGGATNYEDAFDSALNILEARTGNCHEAILCKAT